MSINPLLRLAFKEPHLLVDHLSAYAALASEEVSKTFSSLALRIGLYVGAGVMALFGLIMLGVDLLLVATTSSLDWTPWLMIAVPLVPLVAAAVMFWMARAKPLENAFDTLKQQVNADLALLREVNPS